MAGPYPKIAQLRDVRALRTHLSTLDIELPLDDRILTAAAESPLAAPLMIDGFRVGNRWCVHPMEGWDANADGSPSELTLRRWRNFGLSGAKWIWGGEAAAVREDGRANPHQTLAIAGNKPGLAMLRDTLVRAHQQRFGDTSDLFVGLQLTHSGRFCRLKSGPAPRIAYHHPLLDAKFGIDPTNNSIVWTDDELESLIDDYVASARIAWDVGFHFVDIKCCHGYLLHEFLSARRRPGRFGGDLEGRTRVVRTIIERIRTELPSLRVVVRLSVFDTPPFHSDFHSGQHVGRPMDYSHLLPYEYAFGADPDDPMSIGWQEPLQFITALQQWGVVALNVSCGSPYYNPHIQRPAIFPPSDGYLPPEDPLVGVARQIHAARHCKQAFPALAMVGTGYSYLQDYLPHVAQGAVRAGWIDAVGLGRMILSYPDLPADCLERGALQRKRVCRTFSDCTTAPRNGLVSGCFPLDPFYKTMPANETLKAIKKQHGGSPPDVQ